MDGWGGRQQREDLVIVETGKNEGGRGNGRGRQHIATAVHVAAARTQTGLPPRLVVLSLLFAACPRLLLTSERPPHLSSVRGEALVSPKHNAARLNGELGNLLQLVAGTLNPFISVTNQSADL